MPDPAPANTGSPHDGALDEDALRSALVHWLDRTATIGGGHGAGDTGATEIAAAEALHWFIKVLDLCIVADWDACGFPVQALTRAIAAAGPVLVAHKQFPPGHPVHATIAAAEAYVREPTEASYAAYFAAATRSYPYGAGEGSYSMIHLDHCAPGSGCASGAGSLDQVAHACGATPVLAAITAALGPWLRAPREHSTDGSA